MAIFLELPDLVVRDVSPNELGIDQKDDGLGNPGWDDPIKVRFGAWKQGDGKYYIAAIGFDVLTRNGSSIRREEVGFLKFAIDEMVDGDGDPVPMVALFLSPRVGADQDADMQPVVTVSRKGVRFHVPIWGLSIPGPPAAIPNQFQSDHGQFRVNWQDDAPDSPTELPTGIVYRTNGSENPNDWQAVGRVRVDPL